MVDISFLVSELCCDAPLSVNILPTECDSF